MTLTEPRGTGAFVVVPSHRQWRQHVTSPAGLCLALTVVAFAVRSVGLTHSFELWVDEMLYADLGASAGRGEMPQLADGPFFLHPPGFFLVEGGIIRLLRIPTSDSMSLAFDLRWLTAALGALTVGLVFLLTRRLAGIWPAAWAALVLAWDPFVLRINSRVFVESLAVLMLVAGLLIVVRHLQNSRVEGRAHVRMRNSAPGHLIAGGLLLGYAVFTKDAFLFFAMAPIGLAVVWRRTLALRDAAAIVAAAAIPYSLYLGVVAATGNLPQLARAKFAGVQRLIGTDVFTGFNAPGAPSLFETLMAQVERYGTSYVVLLLCPLAGVVAACSRWPERRLVGLVALATGAYGVYMVGFGTAEEHYAYPILVVGAVALAVLVRMLLNGELVRRRVTLSLLVLFLLAETTLGARQELTRDDGLLTFRSWADRHLPSDVKVGATNGASGYALADDPRFGPWPTARLLKLRGAQYVLTFDVPTREGYTLATPEMLDWLEVHATAVFQTYGPTNGNTVLWYIDRSDLAVAAARGVGEQPGVAGPAASAGYEVRSRPSTARKPAGVGGSATNARSRGER
jgi:hypothetical protein